MSGQRDSFETQTRRVFDASVAGIDPRTRSKLARARAAALEKAAAPGFLGRLRAPRMLVPAGAAAAAVLAVWLVWQPPEPEAGLTTASLRDLEILLGEEELDMLAELEFYAWLEDQLDEPVDAADDDIG
jgi:hypothetical protein